MRILLAFLIGLMSFFFLSAAIHKVFGKTPHSIFGLSLIVIGFLMGFFGKYYMPQPLDILLGMFLLGAGIGSTAHHLLSKRYIISEDVERNFVKNHEDGFERALEILPGALTWIALTSPFWLSLTLPFAVAYLIILADIYWLLSSLRIAGLVLMGYKRLEYARSQPWLKKLDEDFKDEWEDYYHVFLLPTYKEPINVLNPSFDAISNLNYPKDKVFLAVGFEQRADPKVFHKETIEYLENDISKKIGGVILSFHPADLPGEIPGPGTNRNWMVKTTLEELKKRKIDPEKVIITTLDSDFIIHKEFLAGMLHKYLSTPADIRLKRSLTGSFLYYNNYWDTPAPMRLIATGTALWQLAEMVGSDKYQNFSSMSINLKSLTEIGGWIPNKVNDDSGFYWKAYFHFKGDYKVISHFLPIHADAVLDVNLHKTFQNQYLQLKRWAYGVEHIPFIFKSYFNSKDIDFWDKTDKLLFVLWANLRWGFLAIFVTFAGLIIPYINPTYGNSVVAINLPIVSSWILTAAFLGLFVTIYVHEKIVPKRPKNWNFIQYVWSYLQHLLVPVVLVTISTLPAIDAQTSLMFGRYLEYRTTNKVRVN